MDEEDGAFRLAADDALVVLVDQMQGDVVDAQRDAVRSLATFAVALGEDRVRDELLPFLAGPCTLVLLGPPPTCTHG